MQHQHRALDALGIFRVRRVQGAMERHRRAQVGTGTGQLQCTAATKAETKRADLARLQQRLRLPHQLRQGFLHALAQLATVVLQRHHRRAGLVGVGRTHRLPVQVGNQHHIALLGHFLGDALGTFADTHPVRRHHQAWPPQRARLVDQAAFIRLAGQVIDQRFDDYFAHQALLWHSSSICSP
ncbi:hypothetical protein D3C75_931440 [compost metagenome]